MPGKVDTAKPKPSASQPAAKGPKQSTLASFFGAPRPGPPPRPSQPTPTSTPALSRSSAGSSSTIKPPPPSSSPASTLRTPPSDPASSPLVNIRNGRVNGAPAATGEKAVGSAPSSAFPRGKRAIKVVSVSDDDLTPPPVAEPTKKGMEMDVDGKDEPESQEQESQEPDSPLPLGRRAKRKVVYAESDEDESDGEVLSTTRRKPRKSLKEESDDEFIFDAAADAALAAAADEYEAGIVDEPPSPTPSIGSDASPAPKSKKKGKSGGFVARKSVPKKATTSWYSSETAGPSDSARPGPKPLARGNDRSQTGSASGSNFLLTEAERKKIQAKEDKRDAETCFDFLNDLRDKEGNRPGDTEYDKRTVYIPKNAWNDFTPFEKQFWEIKQNHYDTVLFFQKGKFYELYEDDAMIGHQEFDLKLTDRVKMKMVGVPEQSFEFWASKFLAAGYKVGKVEQAETAIGMEMRTKGGGGGREIVRRELAQVFTNGTIVDSAYLTTDEANHCVAIKELSDRPDAPSSFGICVMDASTGEFNLSAFDDDIVRTRLETMFRQIRPKELVFAKGNLSVATTRMLRNILPASTLWQSFKADKEFLSFDQTLVALEDIFGTDENGEAALPEAVGSMLDRPLAMEALGGMIFYLRSLNLDKDLISQKNFNVYDPIRQGKSLVLDGQTLGHMEVLMNNEGGEDGTLLKLLQRCQTPFGKRLFRIWLTSPLRDAGAINDRLNAVEDLMSHPTFTGQFTQLCKNVPDLERLVSRIHAGSLKISDFIRVVDCFDSVQRGLDKLVQSAEGFDSASVPGLLCTAPDLHPHLKHINSMYTVEHEEKTMSIFPTEGADEECDDANAAVAEIENQLDDLLAKAKKIVKGDCHFWHSAQGNKEIFQIQVSASAKVPSTWTKCSSTKNYARYYTPETLPVIRQMQEARETQATAKKSFFRRLLAEFDKDRTVWLKMIRVVAELDCLVSLAKASNDMDEPKCRPEFVEASEAFIDFQELRHPSMCLQRDFIANDVQLGQNQPRTTLLTGPNMAGKSTLLRMTAAAVIMAQMGCYVPAAQARLSPIDKIQTRMGAYDNMFASASTFKVELDECSKILREAGPKSLVILDELGRGTSTYDGMAIAGAVLHHISTHTLPLGFFATHYGSLTDEFAYHPNIRNMHMQVHVDDDQGVVFLYKLISGHAESSHGTHVAKLAGVPPSVIARADQVSAEFFEAFKTKLEARRQSAIPLTAQADFVWLLKLAGIGGGGGGSVEGDGMGVSVEASVGSQLEVIRRAMAAYQFA